MHQLTAEDVLCVPVVNWSAPSLQSSEHEVTQAAVLGALVNSQSPEQGNSVGVVFAPCFAYAKGQVWRAEEGMNKLLVNTARVNFDANFVLPFSERADERDQRQPVRCLIHVSDTLCHMSV